MRQLALCMALAIPATALQAQGTIEGTIYMRLPSGQTGRGAALNVDLLSISAARLSALGSWCDTNARTNRIRDTRDSAEIANAASPDERLRLASSHLATMPAEMKANFEQRAAVLRVASTVSSVDGSFHFKSVRSGDYLVFVEWEFAGGSPLWVVPVKVGPSVPVRIELNNANQASGMNGTNPLDRRIQCASPTQ